MQYSRMYTDAAGESHFDDVGLEFAMANFAPPAPPMLVSSFVPATRVGFLRFPVGWNGDLHPAPRRQFFLALAGEFEIMTSDGAVRRFPPGSVLLGEDTTGKGHAARLLGQKEGLAAIVQVE